LSIGHRTEVEFIRRILALLGYWNGSGVYMKDGLHVYWNEGMVHVSRIVYFTTGVQYRGFVRVVHSTYGVGVEDTKAGVIRLSSGAHISKSVDSPARI
jgi:hypothetical protein